MTTEKTNDRDSSITEDIDVESVADKDDVCLGHEIGDGHDGINSKPRADGTAPTVYCAPTRSIGVKRNGNCVNSGNAATIRKVVSTGKYVAVWEEMYQRLVVYKQEHNSTRISMKHKVDPKFGNWVSNQRKAYMRKLMTEERKHLLESIDFEWELSPTWEEMYERLVAYEKEYKTTSVPTKYKIDPQLGRWVSRQRCMYRDKRMTEDRQSLLDSIGFDVPDFSMTNKATYEEMYRRLVAYKKEYKTTNVPTKYKIDPKLGNWVSKQRCEFRDKTMTEERK